MRNKQLSIQEKYNLAKLEIWCFRVYQEIMFQIKSHLNHMQNSFVQKKDPEGNLSFKNPALYLFSTAEGANEPLAITTANDYLTYSFLAFRLLSEKKPHDFVPNYIVSFDRDIKVTYGSNEVLNTFKYVKNEVEIEPFITKKDFSKSPNPEALKILRADKMEVKSILKNTFAEYAHDCNQLKKTSLDHAKIVCSSITTLVSPDYFLELNTCLEVFNLAKNQELCGNIVYSEEKWDI